MVYRRFGGDWASSACLQLPISSLVYAPSSAEVVQLCASMCSFWSDRSNNELRRNVAVLWSCGAMSSSLIQAFGRPEWFTSFSPDGVAALEFENSARKTASKSQGNRICQRCKHSHFASAQTWTGTIGIWILRWHTMCSLALMASALAESCVWGGRWVWISDSSTPSHQFAHSKECGKGRRGKKRQSKTN